MQATPAAPPGAAAEPAGPGTGRTCHTCVSATRTATGGSRPSPYRRRTCAAGGLLLAQSRSRGGRQPVSGGPRGPEERLWCVGADRPAVPVSGGDHRRPVTLTTATITETGWWLLAVQQWDWDPTDEQIPPRRQRPSVGLVTGRRQRHRQRRVRPNQSLAATGHHPRRPAGHLPHGRRQRRQPRPTMGLSGLRSTNPDRRGQRVRPAGRPRVGHGDRPAERQPGPAGAAHRHLDRRLGPRETSRLTRRIDRRTRTRRRILHHRRRPPELTSPGPTGR